MSDQEKFRIPTDARGDEPRRELDSEHATRLLFKSFYFSQGGTPLQEAIFSWLHTRYPEYRITDQMKDLIEKSILPRVRAVVSANPEDTKGAILHPVPEFQGIRSNLESEIRTQLDSMQEIFERPVERYAYDPLHVVTQNLINRDARYLIRKGSRPRGGTKNMKAPEGDPFLSHLCHYGLNGQPTGVAEYDRMFQEIDSFVREGIRSGVWKRGEGWTELFAVVDKYNETHPDSRVSVE